jgi:hypothetical protein
MNRTELERAKSKKNYRIQKLRNEKLRVFGL